MTILTIVLVVGIGLGLTLLFKHLGITDKDSLQALIKSTGAWGPIVFLLLQVSVSTLLSVIPGTNFTFLIVAGLLFENVFLGVVLALLGVWISSILMFVIGKTLGEKVAIKLVGAESMKKAQDLIDIKSKIYLPIMFLFPFFPDDGLCLAAGLTKMKYKYFIPVIIIFRSIGVLTTVLTSYYSATLFNVLGLNELTPIGWIMLANLILFDVYVVFKFTTWLEKRMKSKKEGDLVVEQENV